MSSPKKNGAREAAPAEDHKPVRIFVKVGALKRFDALKRKTADLPVVVTWDRRRGERRDGDVANGVEAAPPDAGRRASDRRRTPPFTWELADFVVVEEPTPAAPEGETPVAPAKRSAARTAPAGQKPPAGRRPRRR